MSAAIELMRRIKDEDERLDADLHADILEYLLDHQIEREKSLAVLQAIPPFAPTPEQKTDGFWTQWPPRP